MASTHTGTQDPAAVVHDFYEAWVRGDAEQLASHWADDAIMETAFATYPGAPETAPPHLEGGDAIRAFWRAAVQALVRRDLHDLWVRAVEEPGWVVARYRGDMHTADGRAFRASCSSLLRLRDGKVVEYHEYLNPLAAVDAAAGQIAIGVA